ncbi:MAG TPA: hypothetical protein VJB96_02080 [Patescibacteria group bacterium]|nr:hypothetical protein [Patescibacteria group bacterium]
MQHKDLTGNRWYALSKVAQLANIGSEVERAINWKKKGNEEYANLAHLRALELFDLTLGDHRYGKGLKEVARARELWLDYFVGNNQYLQTEEQWKKYFLAFALASRITRS